MDCRICGRQFDSLGFQVMVPGLQHGFDRVDCALEASALELPATRSVEPAPTVVRALPLSVAPVPALAAGPGLAPAAKTESVRPHLFGGANLALIAAGTAATVYLWLRVFGADAGPLSFLAERASQAFGRTTVAASIDLTPETQTRPKSENTIRGGEAPPAAVGSTASATDDGGGTPVSNRSPRKEPRERKPGGGGPVARPTPNPPPSEPPSEPGPTRSAPTPAFPVPSSPPEDRVPGPTLPGDRTPEQPAPPDDGRP